MNPSKALTILLVGLSAVGASEAANPEPNCLNHFETKSAFYRGAITYCYLNKQGQSSYKALQQASAQYGREGKIIESMNTKRSGPTLEECCDRAGTHNGKYTRFKRKVREVHFDSLREATVPKPKDAGTVDYWLRGASPLELARFSLKTDGEKKHSKTISTDPGAFFLCGNLAEHVLETHKDKESKMIEDVDVLKTKVAPMFNGISKASAYSLSGRRLTRGRTHHRGQQRTSHKKTSTNGDNPKIKNEACKAGINAQFHYWKRHYDKDYFIWGQMMNRRKNMIVMELKKTKTNVSMPDLVWAAQSLVYFPQYVN